MFTIKKYKGSLLFLVFLLLIGCSPSQKIDLTTNWKVKIFSWQENQKLNEEFSHVSFDDSNWKNIKKLPAALSVERKKSIVWLRRTVFISKKYKNRDLSVFIGKVWDQSYVYLNGVQIGVSGREYPEFHSDWNASNYCNLSPQIIRYDKDNIIAIRQFTNQQANFNGAPFIGDSLEVRGYTFWEKFLAEFLPMTFGLITLLLGLIMIATYFLDSRKDKLNLHFGGLSILWFFSTMHFWVPYFGAIPWGIQDNLFYVLSAFMSIWIFYYLEMILKIKYKKIGIFVIINAIGVILISVTATPMHPITGWRFNLIGPMGIINEFFWGLVIFKGIKQKKDYSKVLLVGYLSFLFALIHDALMMNRIIMSGFFLMPIIGYPGFLASFVLMLIQRITKISSELEKTSKMILVKNKDLSNVMNKVVESTDDLIQISIDVGDTTKTLNEEMQQQEASLEETSAVVEQISSNIEMVANNAKEQDNEIKNSSSLMKTYAESLTGITQAAEKVVSMGKETQDESLNITKRLDDVQTGMMKLKDSSSEIEKIALMITDIADATNLLSLNAAIEAARAGQEGRGFAVVAEEVGKLADKSVNQSKTIQNIIQGIVENIENETSLILESTNSINHINIAVHDLTSASENILSLCFNQEELTKKLAKRVTNISERSSDIFISTTEQTSAMGEVTTTVSLLNEVVAKVNLSSEKMVEIANGLSHRIAELNRVVINKE